LSLLLFDIDGTLLLSGGAGVRAMTRTFERLFGVRDAFASSDIAGRTDTFILSNALRRAGLPDTAGTHQQFREAYIALLGDEIRRPTQSRTGLMPGVQPLLGAVHQRDGFYLALLTGNFERAAYVKLGHFGIGGFFPWGAFGEESAHRDDLARIALRRAESRSIPAPARSRAVVIGDTPHDVACARAIGARALAVATGGYSVEQLDEAAADMVLPDLSDTARILEFIK
jgi:phosphoglycolate phosphatase